MNCTDETMWELKIMKKTAFIILGVIMSVGTSVYAKNETASLPIFDVTLNGVKVENDYRTFPMLLYKDITYVPMTYQDCRYLGLSTEWDNNTKTLSIEKSHITCAYKDYKQERKNPDKNEIAVCDFNIIVNGKQIDNSKEEYPLLTFRDVTYFPLTWSFAVDEFDWEYSFEHGNGLLIKSDNVHAEKVNLKNIAGSFAADEKYYYYNGNDGDKHVVYRAAQDGTENPEIIFEYPESGMSGRVDFVESEGNIYFYYVVGGSPVTSSRYVMKIQPDGTVIREKPESYSYSSHGYTESEIHEGNITLKAVNPNFDSATIFTYTVDGIEKQAEQLSKRVQVGARRNGLTGDVGYLEDYIKIYDDKIYFTGVDLDSEEDSSLYVIDTKTGKTEKLLNGVFGFHMYTGWLNEEEQDSTMILYDNNGNIMRYTECNGEIREIEKIGRENTEPVDENLVFISATGGFDVSVFLQYLDGSKTVVKEFGCYASGTGSINGTVFETSAGAKYEKSSEYLCAYTLGEAAADNVRIVVPGGYYSTDVAESVFIYKDALYYKLYGEDNIVKVKLN